jgi:hypothetical protein
MIQLYGYPDASSICLEFTRETTTSSRIDKQNTMEIHQRNAKKFKYQEEEYSSQMKPLLPADPCPLLRPFCHQV